MTERCKNCGAELFAGQQFCRQCGARTGLLTHDDIATRILPGQPANAPTATAPLGGDQRNTDPFTQRSTEYYQPQPVVPLAPAATPAAPQQRRSSVVGWLLALLLVFVVGAVGLLSFLIYQTHRPPVVRVIKNIPPVPPVPPAVPAPPEMGDPAAGGETLDEDGADISDDETVINKTFPLAADTGQFDLSNFNGDIRIEAWDEPQAQVKVTKHGGSPEQRGEVEIKVAQNGNHLGLSTTPRQAGVKDVLYEIKLPRHLQHVVLHTMNGDVKLKGVHASIEATTQHGDIDLENVGGALKTNTLAGDTKVTLADPDGTAPQSINTVNGDVELHLGGLANAQISVETLAGDISSDDSLGLKVQKQMVGQRLNGQLGHGGAPIVIKSVHGDITIKK